MEVRDASEPVPGPDDRIDVWGALQEGGCVVALRFEHEPERWNLLCRH